MLKIWGRKTSSNVQKVMWTLVEIGIEAERIDIGGPFGGNDQPAYLALNPNGRVPTLVDGDFVLWESNSIVRYLAGKHGGGLEPTDARECALADQWMDWATTVFAVAHQDAFIGLIRTKPEARDTTKIEASKAAMIAAAHILDAWLASHAYLAGPLFSMGDMPASIICRRYLALVAERPELPHLMRWYGDVATRRGFVEHVDAVPLS